MCLYARQSVRNDLLAIATIAFYISYFIAAVIVSTSPLSGLNQSEHEAMTIYDAPLTSMICSPLWSKMTDILLRAELKGYFKKVGFYSLTAR